ncbi:hypothetical protein NDU88_011399 [Pleurodeles waltl]|uniref:Uncharacterized protein n=1 Tax=Pleurodeles waltl TaxID=8319 RepID=A0AAV7QX43_PLEWA|nr:hypothetical protein NDU88_011399 [Pleurodeles waltl]
MGQIFHISYLCLQLTSTEKQVKVHNQLVHQGVKGVSTTCWIPRLPHILNLYIMNPALERAPSHHTGSSADRGRYKEKLSKWSS